MILSKGIMHLYSILALLLLVTSADAINASTCHVCERNDPFLSTLKNICHVHIQTNSKECCQYYKLYPQRCGKACSSEAQQLHNRIESTFVEFYENSISQSLFHPTTAHSIIQEYLSFAQNMENIVEFQTAKRLEQSLIND